MPGVCSTLLTMGWQRYLDIILYRTYAELKAEAQLSYMGYLWWILEPIMNTLLFYLILTALLDRPTSGAFAFIIVGAIIWQWLNASVLTAANSVVEAGDMLKQIYLPKAVLPLISILTSTWRRSCRNSAKACSVMTRRSVGRPPHGSWKWC